VSQADNPIDYAYSERVRETDPDAYGTFMTETLDGHSGIWVAKLGWAEVDGDIRPELIERGYVTTTPEIDYGVYLDEGGMFVWRLDLPPQGDPVTVYRDANEAEALTLRSAQAQTYTGGVTVNVLWSLDDIVSREYTVSAFVLGADGAFANHDSVPLEGRSSTTTWTPDGLYFDSHIIDTSTLPAGDYQVGVAVYFFTDQTFTDIENLRADDCTDSPDDCRFVFVDTVTIGAE